jgi:glycine cleavage system T protein (aminomethyltransferase)
MSTQILRHSPFHARTGPLVRSETWRRWAGHLVASAYDSHPEREYAAVRNSAALFDVSPLYKYRITGTDAARLLDRMVTRNVAKCRVGQVLYTPWCDHAGKVIDDGTVHRLGESEFRLTSADPSLRWLAMSAGAMDVSVRDESHEIGALALQGPLSRDILEQVSPADFAEVRFFRLVQTTIDGIDVTISRTGYTGDLGYEIWVPRDDAVSVWDSLMRAGSAYGITPAGIWALDIARIEAGLVMLGVDYFSSHHAMIEDQKSSPYELSLGWTVSADKGPFTGRLALRREAERGAAWGFVGLEVDWESLERLHRERGLSPHVPTVAWRTSAPAYIGREQVGYATSGCWSPLLKQYLALAHLRSPHFAAGTKVRLEVTVEHRRRQADAIVAKLPFFEPERKKA